MILELKIENFLSFKDEVKFSFEATSDNRLKDYYIATQPDGTRLLKMAMVYGANASGKSNLIKAFQLIKDFTKKIPKESDINTSFIPFSFDNTKKKPGSFELVFYVKGVKHKYHLLIDENLVQEENLYFYPGTQPAIIFNRFFDKETETSVIEFGPKIKISSQALEAIQLKTLKNTSVLAAFKQVNISLPEIAAVKEWFEDQFMTSINPYHLLTEYSDGEIKNNPKIKENALKFLKKADFNIVDILFEETIKPITEDLLKLLEIVPISDEEKSKIKKEKVLHQQETIFSHRIFKNGKEKFYPLSKEQQSRGTKRFYGLSAPYFHTLDRNAFLPIDEIGSALHPLLVIHFIKEFLQNSDQAQLLFTTHNLSLLNEKDILRKDAIWFTEKQEDGSTTLYSMADFNFRKELSFYNAYKHGKFGAIPRFE